MNTQNKNVVVQKRNIGGASVVIFLVLDQARKKISSIRTKMLGFVMTKLGNFELDPSLKRVLFGLSCKRIFCKGPNELIIQP